MGSFYFVTPWYTIEKSTLHMIKFIDNSAFSFELKKKVREYFTQKNISQKGNGILYFKTAFWILLCVSLYTTLVFFTPSNTGLSIILCMMLGCGCAGVGFNIMHDAAHGSYSENTRINTFFAYSLDALGASSYFWDKKHNITHHTFTNTDHDDDINTAPFLRLYYGQQWKWWYGFQGLYVWVLYACEYILWVFFFDFKKYFKGRVSHTRIPMNTKQKIFFWSVKVYYLSVYFGIPMYVVGPEKALIGYFVMASMCGIVISIVFQLAHIQEKSSFPVPKQTKQEGVSVIENEFYVHQLQTTANFATQSRLVSWLLGGLNFQIEHHLFPKISHVHYPALQKIIQDVCRKYDIPYHHYPTLLDAFESHVRQIYRLSQKQNPASG